MISLGYNYLFTHVPKTGGSALTAALEPYSDDVVTWITPDLCGLVGGVFPCGKHTTLAAMQAVMAPALFRRLFKFAVVRNPWERMISWYCWAKQAYRQPSDPPFAFDAEEFKTWMNDKPAQVDFLKDAASGELLTNHLLRHENLDTDFQLVCDRLGLPRLALRRVNASDHDDFASYYDAETIALVGERYAADVAQFGYQPPTPKG